MLKSKKTPWYIAGLHFECIQCGRCCSGPGAGYIWVTRREIELIADLLKMPTGQVRREYLRRVGLRTTVIEKPTTRDCMFLQQQDGQRKCGIYPVSTKNSYYGDDEKKWWQNPRQTLSSCKK